MCVGGWVSTLGTEGVWSKGHPGSRRGGVSHSSGLALTWMEEERTKAKTVAPGHDGETMTPPT